MKLISYRYLGHPIMLLWSCGDDMDAAEGEESMNHWVSLPAIQAVRPNGETDCQ